MKKDNGALDGIKVLDFSLAMSGPFAAQKLGDMGAEVIKIEPTGDGEWHRTRPAANAWVNKLNSSFVSFNRNKNHLIKKRPHPNRRGAFFAEFKNRFDYVPWLFIICLME